MWIKHAHIHTHADIHRTHRHTDAHKTRYANVNLRVIGGYGVKKQNQKRV